MANYRGASTLKKAALNLLVKVIDPKSIKALREQFEAIDVDGSEIIHPKELTRAIKDL